jgi:hypothetical protein
MAGNPGEYAVRSHLPIYRMQRSKSNWTLRIRTVRFDNARVTES